MIFFMVNCVSKINVARCLLARISFGLTSHWPASVVHGEHSATARASVKHLSSFERTDHFVCWLLYLFLSLTLNHIDDNIHIELRLTIPYFCSSHFKGIIDYAHVYVCVCIWMIRNWIRFSMAYAGIQMKHGSTFHDTHTHTNTCTLGLSAVFHYTTNM